MNTNRAITWLGAFALIALIGLIGLAWAERPMPDVLAGALTTALGALAALAVQSRQVLDDDEPGRHAVKDDQ